MRSGGWRHTIARDRRQSPKRHIVGESGEATAIRELRAEKGAEGEIVKPLGTVEFQSGTDTIRTQYHLCRLR